MVLKDGEKWACAACVRGHRVSSCQHTDRDLVHINKKGRPVSQCQHCRGLRKSRAAHVKCDCGEHHHHHDGNGLTTDIKEEPCPCATGARCTCAFKKEILDPDDMFKVHKPVHHKPAIPARRSETAVPQSRNGHHPPLHRQNNSAHQFGIPYTIKKFHADDPISELSTVPGYFPEFDLGSTNALQQAYPTFAPNSPHDTRLTRSAHASPVLGPVQGLDLPEDLGSTDLLDFVPPTYPYINAQFNANNTNSHRHSIADFSNFNLDDLDVDYAAFPSQPSQSGNDLDWPQLALEQQTSYEATDNPNFYRQPPSNPSIDYSSERPGLSHSSSGTASEIGEPTLADYSTSSNTLRPQDNAVFDFATLPYGQHSYGLSSAERDPSQLDPLAGFFAAPEQQPPPQMTMLPSAPPVQDAKFLPVVGSEDPFAGTPLTDDDAMSLPGLALPNLEEEEEWTSGNTWF